MQMSLYKQGNFWKAIEVTVFQIRVYSKNSQLAVKHFEFLELKFPNPIFCIALKF